MARREKADRRGLGSRSFLAQRQQEGLQAPLDRHPLARAVEDAARLHSFVGLIGSSNDSLEREREIKSAFSARRVDGVIPVPAAGSHRFLRAQQQLGLKVVCVDRPADQLEADTVVVDNRQGAYRATRHLMLHGRRRIDYLGDRADIWAVRERFAGFIEALAEDSLTPDPDLVRHGLRARAEAAEAARALLCHPDPPTRCSPATTRSPWARLTACTGSAG